MIKHLRGQLKGENVYSDSKFLRVQFVASWSIRVTEAYIDKVLHFMGDTTPQHMHKWTRGNHQKQVPVVYLIHIPLPLKVFITSPDRFPTRQQTLYT